VVPAVLGILCVPIGVAEAIYAYISGVSPLVCLAAGALAGAVGFAILSAAVLLLAIAYGVLTYLWGAPRLRLSVFLRYAFSLLSLLSVG
jgi:hypothetical protein